MTMKRGVLIVICAALFPLLASAQTVKPKQDHHNLSDDFGFYAGVYTPMYKGQETDLVLGLTYGHFYSNGLGYRAGFQWVPRVAEIDNSYGFPVAFAYRTRSRDSAGRLERGAIAAGETFGYEVIMGYSGPLRGALAAFLANLFSDVEFSAGITPGYISGESSPVSTAYWGVGPENRENTWTEKNGSLSLTLDAGACFNYRIWRFDLKLSPVFHYNLTKNHLFNRETFHTEQGTDIVQIVNDVQPLRWFFSLTGGLSFKF